jgi:hypothetical protein
MFMIRDTAFVVPISPLLPGQICGCVRQPFPLGPRPLILATDPSEFTPGATKNRAAEGEILVGRPVDVFFVAV